jgi:hypothetical protein
MNRPTEQVLVEAVRRGLDYSANTLDWPVRARLQQARLQALDRHIHWSAFLHLPSFSGGFATAAVVTLAVTLGVLPNATDLPPVEQDSVTFSPVPSSRSDTPDTVVDAKVMEVLMSGEEMDFLENLDMYEWLAAEYG